MAGPAGHRSYFTYNLARPYPFRWFTPVAVFIFVVGIGLFSLLNFAANGYVLVNQVSTNPNVTVIEGGTWFKSWPSFFVGTNRPKCQPFMLQNLDTVFTNNTALTYSIAGITRADTGTVLSSAEYNNNVIEACSISSIDVDLQGVSARSSKQFGFTQWGAVTRAFITCNVNGPQGLVVLNMTTTYDYVLDRTSLTRVGTFLGTGFIQRDKAISPNLWWGESLMSLHWDAIAGTMEDIQNAMLQEGDIILKGIVSFTQTSKMADIRDLGFFSIDYRFTVDNEDRTIGLIFPGSYNDANDEGRDIAILHDQEAKPNVWIQTDNLVKSMYSTILTDLGQVNAVPNILTDQDLVRHFLRDANDTLEMPVSVNAQPGPATRENYVSGTSTNIVSRPISPSVMSASYLCQVPKRKSTGNLLVSIVIADLVFLQAVWIVFKFIVDAFILEDDDHNFFRSQVLQDNEQNYNEANTRHNKLFGGATAAAAGATTSSTRLLPPYTSHNKSASATSLPGSSSDVYETDQGYMLSTLNDGDIGSRKDSRSPGLGVSITNIRRPFHRRTSSSYDVLPRDRERDWEGQTIVRHTRDDHSDRRGFL